MDRLQVTPIQKDLDKKMVFITGPRQVGKTTLALSLKKVWPQLSYLNFDADEDRLIILKKRWDRKSPLVILDEVHKLKKWKSHLKGVYDTEGIPPRLLVTGSARLDVYRRGGDSLAGRYFLHHLDPLSVRELRGQGRPEEILDQLMTLGGFPEPFLEQSDVGAERWRKLLLDRVIREDIQDLEPIRELQSLRLLIDLLRERVGSPLSYASLSQDLQVSPHTVRHWIQILENMCVIFVVTPFHRNLARAILKEPKIYFYDTGAVRGDRGIRLENAVAICLLKWVHFLEDTQGKDLRLHYIRDKEKREVDFAIAEADRVTHLIEVKLSDTSLARSLAYYHQLLSPKETVQLVHAPIRRQSVGDISILPAAPWLDGLEI